jgi:hypothetical protein
MAWEARGKGRRRFYYRSQRVGKTVRKVYLGCGEVGRRAAAQDAAARAKRVAEEAELAKWQAVLAGAEDVLAEVQHGAELLAEATLLARGFHEHRGQWRLRRGSLQAE